MHLFLPPMIILKKMALHLASSTHLFSGINSNFMVYLAIMFCSKDFPDMIALPRVKKNTLVDIKCLEVDIHLASI